MKKKLKTSSLVIFTIFFFFYLSAYRQGQSTQQLLVPLIEEWWKRLNNNIYVGAVIMNWSRAFDCIFHDLVIAKLAAYSLSLSDLKLMLSYLSYCQQCVKKQYLVFRLTSWK